jgi:hypothetical protein
VFDRSEGFAHHLPVPFSWKRAVSLFPHTRRLILAAAILGPCLLLTAFLLLARGCLVWAGGVFTIGMIIALMFPVGIVVPRGDTGHEAASRRTPLTTWAWRIASYCLFVWLSRQPEIDSLSRRIWDESALWNWWIIVPFAVLTAAIIYEGVRSAARLTDEAIYRYFAGDVPWQIGLMLRDQNKGH